MPRQAQLDGKYDVIVVGAGPSGFIAAIAAARAGARTLLVERYGFLGGMPTAAMIGPISPFHFGDEQVIEGIPHDFVERMVAEAGSTGHVKCTNSHGNGSYVCFYDHQVYKSVAMDMALEVGVTPLLHSFVADVLVMDRRVVGITLINKSGTRRYRGEVIVDATGDGDVAARAGAPYVIGRENDAALQPVTMMFEMANVDCVRVKKYVDDHPEDFEWASECVPLTPLPPGIDHPYFIAQGLRSHVESGLNSGELHLGRDTVLFLSSVRPGVLHFNSTRVVDVDVTEAHSVTRAEIDARRQVMSLSRYLTKHVPGFENAHLSSTGSQIGVRESRHILGSHVLTADDVVRGQKFSDVIARGYFPIDIHNPKGKTGYGKNAGTWSDLLDSYDIPYRCLLPRGLDGVIVAGRAISATHEAHGSLRTQGGVMAIGQAAGTAAALCARERVQPRDLDIESLQRRLEADGASLRRDPQKVDRQARRAEEAVARALAQGEISGLPHYREEEPSNKPEGARRVRL